MSPIANFHAAAVRFGKPGLLYIAPLGTAEPASEADAWPTAWVPLGYTDTGSAFSYTTNIDKVEVAEELDPIAYTTTSREAKVDVSLAEMTLKNLNIAFNGGVVSAASQDDAAWTFEPPDLGTEQRVMLGWDAKPDPTNVTNPNDLRFIFRRVLNGGSLNIENRKGTQKQLIVCSFNLEKPTDGKPMLRILGSGALNPTP